MNKIINTTNIEAPELAIYSEQSEVQLYHINEPDPGIFIAESPKVIERALDAGYEPISLLLEDKKLLNNDAETSALLKRLDTIYDSKAASSLRRHDASYLVSAEPIEEEDSSQCFVPVYAAPDSVLASITGFHLTRGVLCAMKRKVLPSVSDICVNSSRIAVLENVTNPTNVGAIVRSAAALGMDAVLFSYGCTDPLYRRAIRVSMGTIFQIPWTFLPKDGSMEILKSNGYTTVAMALRENTKSIDDEEITSKEKLAVYLGAEGDGLKQETIDSCDYTVCIPMYHGVDSLNVAAASAVAFWALKK